MPASDDSKPVPPLAVLADDLTGAAEIAGVGWRFGLTAAIATEPFASTNVQLVCLDTDTRLCPPSQAAERVAQAARSLSPPARGQLYKKVDSVLRGNVVDEILALVRVCGKTNALLAPANPRLGRTIKNGIYYVHGTPLAETDFRNDPHHPRTRSEVLALLTSPPGSYICSLRRGEALPPTGISVVDACSSEEVLDWASRVTPETLAAGGADFFQALLERSGLSLRSPSPETAQAAAGPTLAVCGSISASTREFLAKCRSQHYPVLPLPSALLAQTSDPARVVHAWAREAVEHLAGASVVVLCLDLPRIENPERAEILSQHLISAAAEAIRLANPARVTAEGGATAAALCRIVQWKYLEVHAEHAQGIVSLRPNAAGPILTIKPGSYAWPEGVV